MNTDNLGKPDFFCTCCVVLFAIMVVLGFAAIAFHVQVERPLALNVEVGVFGGQFLPRLHFVFQRHKISVFPFSAFPFTAPTQSARP